MCTVHTHTEQTSLELPAVFAVVFSWLTGLSFFHAEDEVAVSVAIQHLNRLHCIFLTSITDVCESARAASVLVSGKIHAASVAASAEQIAQIVLCCFLGDVRYLEAVLLLPLKAHPCTIPAHVNRHISPRPSRRTRAAAPRSAIFAGFRVPADERTLRTSKREVALFSTERADDYGFLLRADLVLELGIVLILFCVVICGTPLHFQRERFPVDGEEGLLRVIAQGRPELLPFFALLHALANALLLCCDLHLGHDLLGNFASFVALILNDSFDSLIIYIRLVHVFSNGA
mmetsp:Transcript_14978/g.17960  ORF Transcript_14978/g.17960 Transcript_14978/m.17960 type:complete len:288 (+) Transcript_14978:71-934(+)